MGSGASQPAGAAPAGATAASSAGVNPESRSLVSAGGNSDDDDGSVTSSITSAGSHRGRLASGDVRPVPLACVGSGASGPHGSQGSLGSGVSLDGGSLGQRSTGTAGAAPNFIPVLAWEPDPVFYPDGRARKARELEAWRAANPPTFKERMLARVQAVIYKEVPTPTFNLPVEGWGTDPDAVLQAIEVRRGGKRRRPKKKKKGSKSMFITVDDADSTSGRAQPGPLLDWACLGITEFNNDELKYVYGKTSLDLSHNPLTELPIGIGNHGQLKHISIHDCDFGDAGLPQSFFVGLTKLVVNARDQRRAAIAIKANLTEKKRSDAQVRLTH